MCITDLNKWIQQKKGKRISNLKHTMHVWFQWKIQLCGELTVSSLNIWDSNLTLHLVTNKQNAFIHFKQHNIVTLPCFHWCSFLKSCWDKRNHHRNIKNRSTFINDHLDPAIFVVLIWASLCCLSTYNIKVLSPLGTMCRSFDKEILFNTPGDSLKHHYILTFMLTNDYDIFTQYTMHPWHTIALQFFRIVSHCSGIRWWN